MKIDIQVWSDNKIISEWDYEPEVNQMETIEMFAELLHGTEGPGDGFTLIANRVS